MNILLITADDFCVEDICETFRFYGHETIYCECTKEEMLKNNSTTIKGFMTNNIDIVFTFNYYPSIAIICKEMSVHYISWVYDNPQVHLFSYTAIFPTNTIYVFEKEVAEYFQSQGINNIYYLPLAANPIRLERMISNAIEKKSEFSKPKDVSFVGAMYTEKHQLFSRMIEKGISEYTFGYLNGIIKAQKKIYGCDIITPLLSEDIISEMKKGLPLEPDQDSAVPTEYLFAKYVIDRKITAEERMNLLSLAGEKHDVHVFTIDPNMDIPNCTNHGPAHSDIDAPTIYNTSKINLNISLRSIVNGIPLRAFEIMGSGGFLLSNYQAELQDYFIPGEDYDYFESQEDMVYKIDYYLGHDDIRKQIAINGKKKIEKYHTFFDRVSKMNLSKII